MAAAQPSLLPFSFGLQSSMTWLLLPLSWSNWVIDGLWRNISRGLRSQNAIKTSSTRTQKYNGAAATRFSSPQKMILFKPFQRDVFQLPSPNKNNNFTNDFSVLYQLLLYINPLSNSNVLHWINNDIHRWLTINKIKFSSILREMIRWWRLLVQKVKVISFSKKLFNFVTVLFCCRHLC